MKYIEDFSTEDFRVTSDNLFYISVNNDYVPASYAYEKIIRIRNLGYCEVS
ncbi:hypothetical protein VCRA2126E14_20181 [Vibrio crassostreae]|nr:hypothetical protein VCRA2110O2_20186 [Vibrio crassostreae]CAK3501275.1 hypothetical protein VCRA2126E14_20181 [Vibrio crassostreae]